LDDNFAVVADPSGSRALKMATRRLELARSSGNALPRGQPLCSLKLPTLVAAVSSKQTSVELMNELPCRTGQITALLKQLPPEALGAGLERQRAKRVTHLAQQHRQMPLKASPVTLNELA